MPELPEVETVRRVLEPHLSNKKITGVRIHNAQIIASPSPNSLPKAWRVRALPLLRGAESFCGCCLTAATALPFTCA